MVQSELSLEKYFLIVRTHARLIASIFLGAVLLAAIITYITPKKYTATVLLNFDFKGANPVDSQGRALTEDTYILTQVSIIKSQHVAQVVEDGMSDYEKKRLISALQAENTVIDNAIGTVRSSLSALFSHSDDKPPTDAGSAQSLDVKSAYSWLAQIIGYNLAVDPRFNSRIVELSYSSTDPQVAALMADKFANAYIKTNLQMVIDPARKTTAWFDEQLKSLRKKLEVAQAALTQYQQEQGIVTSDERLDTENSRLQKLSEQYVEAQQATRNAETEQLKMQELMSQGKSVLALEALHSNPVVQNVQTEIRQLEAKMVEISSSLGANHPTYKRVKSELAAARARLSAEIKSITNGIDNRLELARAREKDLIGAIAKQKEVVLALKFEHDKISVLERDMQSAQATYNSALNEMNTTSMQSMIDQTNVSIVDSANVPRHHSSPKAMRNLAVGAFLGLLLGVGLAVLLELFVRRVHSKDDLLLELGIPMLGHLKKV